MRWLKMCLVAWRLAIQLAWPYLLTPWRSPLLRWRMETYEGLDAHRITAGEFFRFMGRNRGALMRFLHWAASL